MTYKRTLEGRDDGPPNLKKTKESPTIGTIYTHQSTAINTTSSDDQESSEYEEASANLQESTTSASSSYPSSSSSSSSGVEATSSSSGQSLEVQQTSAVGSSASHSSSTIMSENAPSLNALGAYTHELLIELFGKINTLRGDLGDIPSQKTDDPKFKSLKGSHLINAISAYNRELEVSKNVKLAFNEIVTNLLHADKITDKDVAESVANWLVSTYIVEKQCIIDKGYGIRWKVISSKTTELNEWWEKMSLQVAESYDNKVKMIEEYDDYTVGSVNTILNRFSLDKSNPSVSPKSYHSQPSIPGDSLTLENGDAVPKEKYSSSMEFLNQKVSDSEVNPCLLFQAVSGIGKTNFSNALARANLFCIMIEEKAVEDWITRIQNCNNRQSMEKITKILCFCHMALLAMLVTAGKKVDPKHFKTFQRNGGTKFVKEMFFYLSGLFDENSHVSIDGLPVIWCIDEAHLFHNVCNNQVNRTDIHAMKGSALTILSSVCRKFGPIFMTTTLTGMLKDIEQDVSAMHKENIAAREIQLPVLFPLDVKNLLSQVMTVPESIVSKFVCHQLVGVARGVEKYFNNILKEAERSTNTSALLMRALNDLICKNISHIGLAKRYNEIVDEKKEWETAIDELVFFGAVNVKDETKYSKLQKKLTKFGLCYFNTEKEKEIMLTSTLERCQLIDTIREKKSWLQVIWDSMKIKLDAGKITEILLSHLLVDNFEQCIAPVLKNHPVFRHYTLVTKYWLHDFPFSMTTKDCHKSTSFMIKLISSHLNIETSKLEKWDTKNDLWCTDLPTDGIPLYPSLDNCWSSLVKFVVHPPTQAGPDAFTILVRRDYAAKLKNDKDFEWINNETGELPPFLPLLASSTLRKDGNKLARDIKTTSISAYYPNSTTTNQQVKKEKLFIQNDIKILEKARTLRLCFSPLMTETLECHAGSLNLTSEPNEPNIATTSNGDVVILFAPGLSTFNTFKSLPLVSEILELCSTITQVC